MFEIISLFQRVLPSPVITTKLMEMIKHDQLLLYVIDVELLKIIADLFDPRGSKKNTLIDCSVVAVAKKIKAQAVFSYDSFYAKKGLKYAEDILPRG